MNFYALLAQLLELVVALVLAPLLTGWINQCRAWLQNRSAPPLLQTYYTLSKLFHKDVLLAHNASSLFRAAPYIIFSCMALAAAIVPTLSTDLIFAPAADAIALVGLFALARVFIALAGMDVGTSFGSLGSRREMFIGFLAEPALLMVFFTALADLAIDFAIDHRRNAGAPRIRDLSEPGFRRRRLHHGLARRKRSRADRQPDDPPRTDHDPRGDDPRILGTPSGADRMGGGVSSCLPILASASRSSSPSAFPKPPTRWRCCWPASHWSPS